MLFRGSNNKVTVNQLCLALHAIYKKRKLILTLGFDIINFYLFTNEF